MPVDVTALAEIVSGNIYRGMQSRAQRRQQEEQARANREAEMAREVALQQANARMGMEQVNQQNMDQFRRAGLELDRLSSARAERELGLRTAESDRREKARRDELAFLKADTIDLLNQAGELTPDREGRIWATDSVGALNEMRSRFEKAYSEGRSAAKEIESLRKQGKDLKDAGLLELLVKPDGTPDKDKQALFSTWLDDPTVDHISMIRQASRQARTLREQAEVQRVAGPLIEKARAGTATGDEVAWLRANNMLGTGDVIPTKGTPHDVAEPLRKRIADLSKQMEPLEKMLVGKIDPYTGAVDREVTGEGFWNARESDADQVVAAAAQLNRLRKEKEATEQQLNAATAGQPGVVGGTAALTGQINPQQMMADFQQRNGRMPTREEWAAMRPQMQGPPR